MEIADFKAKLPAKKALIGFDYGSRRLGGAVSDLSLTIASSYTIVYRRDWTKDEAALRRIIEEKEAGGMVFGLPLQMNGEEGEIAAEVRAFAAKMERTFALPVAFWDEQKSVGRFGCGLYPARLSRCFEKSLIFCFNVLI